jgi:hypothetical protein
MVRKFLIWRKLPFLAVTRPRKIRQGHMVDNRDYHGAKEQKDQRISSFSYDSQGGKFQLGRI